jgi:DNA-binding response OmpR family regulator
MSSVEEMLHQMLKPARILYVEDEPGLADIVCKIMLRKYDCTLDWAASGREALDLLDKNDYDLMLLDLILGDLPAITVAKKARVKSSAMPIVIVTGFPYSKAASEVSQCGVVGLISKPFEDTAFDSIFETFKLKIRTKQDQAFFNSR